MAIRCGSRSAKELPCHVPSKTPHSTDLSDDEWKILEPLVPNAKPGGRPRVHETRQLLNAIFFYVLRGACAWRLLPHDFFLPWQTAYHYYFRAWRTDGTWERVHTVLHERLRRLAGREPTSSAAVIDYRRFTEPLRVFNQGLPAANEGLLESEPRGWRIERSFGA